jgi:hypothetical protein
MYGVSLGRFLDFNFLLDGDTKRILENQSLAPIQQKVCNMLEGGSMSSGEISDLTVVIPLVTPLDVI